MAKDDIFAQHDGTDEIECTFHNDVVSISVNNPWAGSTETGFGATCYVSLTVEQAHELGRWLLSRRPQNIK